MEHDSRTSLTLLSRLRRSPRDDDAWSRFVRRYGSLIEQWCRRWGMQRSDADDLSQNVLMQVARQMEQFRYDPDGSFRAWLKTITYRAWCDFLEQRRRRADPGSGTTEVIRLLNSHEARDDFSRQFEEEWQRELLEEAMRQVRERVQPHTWEIFRLMTQEGLTGPEVATRLDMKVGAVWVAKSKVQKMLREQVVSLERSE